MKLSPIWLIIGIITFLWIIQQQQTPTEPRARDLAYDGTPTNLTLELVNHSVNATVGDLYWLNVKVTNYEQTGGAFVSCGIRNTNESVWLVGSMPFPRLGVETMPIEDACQFPANTQVARVDLAQNESAIAYFAFDIPDRVNYTNAIYCEVTERCWAANASYYRSGTLVYAVDVFPRANYSATGNSSYRCYDDSDCRSLAYRYGGRLTCQSNYCVQENSSTVTSCVGSTCPGPSISQKGWWEKMNDFVNAHSIWTLLIVLSLAIGGHWLWRRRR